MGKNNKKVDFYFKKDDPLIIPYSQKALYELKNSCKTNLFCRHSQQKIVYTKDAVKSKKI